MKPFAFVLALLASAAALAASPVGTWTGRFNVKLPPLPASAPAKQKAMMAKMAAQFKTGKMILDLKADHTYTAKTVGLPFSQTSHGTWSQKGDVVTSKASRPGAKPQDTTLSKDGKRLTAILPNGQGSIVFTR